MLRRRLQDSSSDNWTDVELNDILDEGLRLVQKEVMKFVPDAFMCVVQAPLQANVEFYPLPDGFWNELLVGIKGAVTDTTFTTIERGIYDRDRGQAVSCKTKYDIRGRFITFMAIPAISVNPGYQIQFVPTLSMAVDGLAPDIHQGLHLAVVVGAQIIALGETLESGTPATDLYGKLVADIPLFYQRGGEAQALRVSTGQPIVPGRRTLGTGVDHR